jgi:pyruvate/2-oxoglutarate dehydrogenase complex dihydrolipoamide dehydrogenase (E3) component
MLVVGGGYIGPLGSVWRRLGSDAGGGTSTASLRASMAKRQTVQRILQKQGEIHASTKVTGVTERYSLRVNVMGKR